MSEYVGSALDVVLTLGNFAGEALGLFNRPPQDTNPSEPSRGVMDPCGKKKYPPPSAIIPLSKTFQEIARVPFSLAPGVTYIWKYGESAPDDYTRKSAWDWCMIRDPVIEFVPDDMLRQLVYHAKIFNFYGYYFCADFTRTQHKAFVPEALILPAWLYNDNIAFRLNIQTPLVSRGSDFLRERINNDDVFLDGSLYSAPLDKDWFLANGCSLFLSLFPEECTFAEEQSILDEPGGDVALITIPEADFMQMELVVGILVEPYHAYLTPEQIEDNLYAGLISYANHEWIGPGIPFKPYKGIRQIKNP